MHFSCLQQFFIAWQITLKATYYKNVINRKKSREGGRKEIFKYKLFFIYFCELLFNNQSEFTIFVFKVHLFLRLATICKCDQNTEANTPSKQ